MDPRCRPMLSAVVRILLRARSMSRLNCSPATRLVGLAEVCARTGAGAGAKAEAGA